MAVNPDRQVSLDDLVRLKDMGAVSEISHPERVAVIACPSATDLFVGCAELTACGARQTQMPIHRGFWNRAAKS